MNYIEEGYVMKRISTHNTKGGFCFHYVKDIIPHARWVDSDERVWFGIGKDVNNLWVGLKEWEDK